MLPVSRTRNGRYEQQSRRSQHRHTTPKQPQGIDPAKGGGELADDRHKDYGGKGITARQCAANGADAPWQNGSASRQQPCQYNGPADAKRQE